MRFVFIIQSLANLTDRGYAQKISVTKTKLQTLKRFKIQIINIEITDQNDFKARTCDRLFHVEKVKGDENLVHVSHV